MDCVLFVGSVKESNRQHHIVKIKEKLVSLVRNITLNIRRDI